MWVFAQQVQAGGLVLLVLALAVITATLVFAGRLPAQPVILKIGLKTWLKPGLLVLGAVLCVAAAFQRQPARCSRCRRACCRTATSAPTHWRPARTGQAGAGRPDGGVVRHLQGQ
ncbi:MAG: hypothetical protein WDN06_05045 [Asticcacaulis sp.]